MAEYEEKMLITLIQRARRGCHLADLMELVKPGFFTQEELRDLLCSLIHKNQIVLYGTVSHNPVGQAGSETSEQRLFLNPDFPLSVLQRFDKAMNFFEQVFTIGEMREQDEKLQNTEHYVQFNNRLEVVKN